jgi:transposase InsO family protein
MLPHIDDFTRKTVIHTVTTKHDIKETFKEFKNMVENKRGKVLHTDNGIKYVNTDFQDYVKCGVMHQRPVLYKTGRKGE